MADNREIWIDEQYFITFDSYNITLNEKKTILGRNNVEKEVISTVGYYGNLNQLLNGLVAKEIKDNKSFTELKAIAKRVEELGKALENEEEN